MLGLMNLLDITVKYAFISEKNNRHIPYQNLTVADFNDTNTYHLVEKFYNSYYAQHLAMNEYKNQKIQTTAPKVKTCTDCLQRERHRRLTS